MILEPLIEAVIELSAQRPKLLLREPLLRRIIKYLLIFRPRPRLIVRLTLPILVYHDARRAYDQHRQHNAPKLQKPRIYHATLIPSLQNIFLPIFQTVCAFKDDFAENDTSPKNFLRIWIHTSMLTYYPLY
ncbi:MAG TPA: hypothetical protein DIW34_09130 [Oribacterium sp.]|nr:hypothetical protein [Oribacterium sp.]